MFALSGASLGASSVGVASAPRPFGRGAARGRAIARVSGAPTRARLAASASDDASDAPRDGGVASRVAALAASVAVALAPCSPALAGKPPPAYVATLTPTTGFERVRGEVRFETTTNKSNQEVVVVSADISGLAPGAHAINVHELGGGTCADGASCVGPSFNPQERPHGGPNALKKFGASACHFVGEGCLLWRHIGDLGNIEAGADGVSAARFKDQYVSLKPGKEANIVGRSVVIRERADDFVTQGDQDGDAGNIVAYGTIRPADA